MTQTLCGSTRLIRTASSKSCDTESASAMSGVIISNMKFFTLLECFSLQQIKRSLTNTKETTERHHIKDFKQVFS